MKCPKCEGPLDLDGIVYYCTRCEIYVEASEAVDDDYDDDEEDDEMSDDPDHTSIIWNALNTAIEALDCIRSVTPKEYIRNVGMIQDLLQDTAWYAGDLQFEKAVIQGTQEMKAWIREERGMTQWRVCAYPTHENILAINETYGTQKEAEGRLDIIRSRINEGGCVVSRGPKPGTVRILNGKHIVGAMMYEVDERWRIGQ